MAGEGTAGLRGDDEAAWKAALEARILALLAREMADPPVDLGRDTRRDEVAIDSIDLANVMFALEDEYRISIDVRSDVEIVTVGDLIDVLIEAAARKT